MSAVCDVMHHVASVTSAGMNSGLFPVLVPGASTGGTYFLRDAVGTVVGMLKPQDEEPYGVNNPKDRVHLAVGGFGMKRGKGRGYSIHITASSAAHYI